MWRRVFYWLSAISFVGIIAVAYYEPDCWVLLLIWAILFLIGVYDITQSKNNILRNYPIVGHIRYLLLGIRPQIQQYFIESEQNGAPFNKEDRVLVYRRAKLALDTLPFGTLRDVYGNGFESINHSLAPKIVSTSEARITVGNFQCSQPYHASRLNISAMSFGAISQNAVLALNRGARLGNFAHNTGEGGLSPYHLQEGGDIIWQIGTAYFGCRTLNGDFDPVVFTERARLPQIKMIEIKLSQGAKPAHGGILPGVKVTAEIAAIRGLEIGKDAISPPAHTSFSNPIGLLEFVANLRELSGGKPVGFKLCIGLKSEFLSICKAILQTGIYPDFITVDGAEGGTGAAPVEFVDYIGTPLNDGLVFVHNSLVGINAREHTRVICSGKIITGFDMVAKMALGADMCNSARAMMFALGCIQSRRCNTNTCPTGVATQDPKRMYALKVNDKAIHVRNFHDETIKSFLSIVGAMGITTVNQIQPWHLHRRIHPGLILNYDEIYDYLKPGILLTNEELPIHYKNAWSAANAQEFVAIRD